jgi:GPH family glycoside/pentoside/hexuronide:cation symporter
MTQAPTQTQTSNKTRWSYAFFNLGLQLAGQIFGISLLFFYTDVKRLPAAWAATALTLYAFYNAFNNPLIGFIQDRTKSKWGRRLPYLRFGALPMMIVFALLWLAPFDGNQQPVALLIWFVIGIVCYDALATAVGTAYYSLLPAMFTTYAERTDAAARMNIFLIIALLLGVALPPIVAAQLGWGTMGLIFAAIGVVAMYIGQRAFFETSHVQSELSFKESLRATFLNRSFLAISIAQTMRFVTTNAMSTGMAFYVKYSLKLGAGETSAILATAFVVAALMQYPWRQLVASKFEPRTTGLIAYATVALAVLTLWFANTFVSALIAAALIGVGFAGIFLMDNILISDVIDADELKTGQRREGMFFGINSLVVTLSTAIVSVVFGLVTSAYGYDTALAVQPESAGQGFRVLMTLLPFAGCALAFVVLVLYPLHGEKLRAMKAALAAQRG